MAGTVGAVASRIIVSVVSILVFPKPSLHLIYTVFVPSPDTKVCAMLALHVVQLVGFAVLPNATSTPPTPASVAQVVVNTTAVPLAWVAPVFTVKLPPVGGDASCVLLVLTDHTVAFNKLSLALTK